MQKVVFEETHSWCAFKKHEIPLTISVVQNPTGLAVYISTDDAPRAQHLDAVQAERMFYSLATALWGLEIKPVLSQPATHVEYPVYCKKCGKQIGYYTMNCDKAEVIKEYHFKATLVDRCCRATRNRCLQK